MYKVMPYETLSLFVGITSWKKSCPCFSQSNISHLQGHDFLRFLMGFSAFG